MLYRAIGLLRVRIEEIGRMSSPASWADRYRLAKDSDRESQQRYVDSPEVRLVFDRDGDGDDLTNGGVGKNDI